MNIFHQKTYKKALEWALEERKRQGRQITLSKLASACHVQKTYLSRVLNRDGHFNSDQLHLAGKFLNLNARELRYVGLLHEAERSNVAERKETLLREARKIQARAKSTENYIATEPFENQSLQFLQYHLNPTLQLIHLFLTISRYAKSPRLIEEQLFLTKGELAGYLDQLAKMKLISWSGQKWNVARETVHLPREAEVYPYYRILSRTKALEKLQRGLSPNDYSFSAIFSADEKTRESIREKFMEFLGVISALVKKADPTDVYQIGFDLLGWSDR